ncbi:MAG TPA: glycoside hydrolase family 15 protein [Sporichthya sp.]|nr:glycoside hydrolase family 15 protein [Sporichthya sp.]
MHGPALRWTTAALLTGALGCAAAAGIPREARPPLYSAGVAGAAFGPGAFRVTLPPDATGTYLPGTSLLAGSDLPAGGPVFPAGQYPVLAPTTPIDLESLAAGTRDWLGAGTIPGRTAAERDVATRALLDLALLTDSTGASVASLFGPWGLVWPRDASWHAAAFAATGHPEQARAILDFLARTQTSEGAWAARYRPDGTPVTDGRAPQLDAVGWVPWAVWSWWRASPPRVDGDTVSRDTEALRALWPMLARAADAAAAALGPDGLPRASADYWEQRESQPTIGTAAPLLLGLRSAAAVAADLGEAEAARTWTEAAHRLDAAINHTFGDTGYRRYPEADAGPDSAVTFRSAPLAAPHDDPGAAAVTAAIRRAEAELLMPSGGLRPGNIPRVGAVAWTPATALFALAAAGRGDEADFQRWFGWLAAHRTALGALPEKVADDGFPASVAPLGWTCSIVLLALVARDGGVLSPPP